MLNAYSLPDEKSVDELMEEIGDDPKHFHALFYDWSFWARPDQMEPGFLPDGTPWSVWLQMGGRGAGKTRAGAEWLRSKFEGPTPLTAGPHAIGMLVGMNPSEVRDVMIEGPSGILAVCPPDMRPEYRPGTRRLIWPNGAYCMIRSSSDPESLRGPNIEIAWADEVAKWRYADDTWDNLELCLRAGDSPKVCVTTTPRPTKLMKLLFNDPGTYVTKATTFDNPFLADRFVERIRRKFGKSMLGRQELYAELLGDNPYALWKLSQIDELRVGRNSVNTDDLDDIKIGVDPPKTSGEDADECGIVVAGRKGRHAFVLDDLSEQGLTPEEWAAKVVTAYEDYKAGGIIAESNAGGEMVRAVLQQKRRVPVRLVHAYRGKVLRAEPVSLLYEQGRVHHVGTFPELEDQMSTITVDYDAKEQGSPDRVDALVYVLMDLMLGAGQVTDEDSFMVTPMQSADDQHTESSEDDFLV